MSTLGNLSPAVHAAPWGGLPPRIKVLLVAATRGQGKRLTAAFGADSAAEIALDEVVGIAAGVARLREEAFDAILATHEPGLLDGIELIEALRGAGTEEPVIVVGMEPEQDLSPLCLEAGADGYCCLASTTTRSLIWTFARAIERHQLIRENRRLVQAERQRLQYEHQEAERLLDQQRSLVRELERIQDGHSASGANSSRAGSLAESALDANAGAMPAKLVEHYRELLRTYVIMGSGNLAGEMSRLAEMLVAADVTARQTMQLHVQALEELIRGLGSRSARHVMTRADLLVVEILVHLAESYRRRARAGG